MREKIGVRRPPSGGSRPVPIGSRSIAVSLQPAIPRQVAPQQSPLPLHRSPTIVAQSRSGAAIKCAAQPHCKVQSSALLGPVAKRECHLYFARRVTFLSCADTLLAKIRAAAGARLGCPAEQVELADGCARAPDGRSLAFAELAADGLRVTTAFGNDNRLTYTYGSERQTPYSHAS